ncbi:MAG: UDP-3-O-acyl-N-acetylglucosamine deacetylase [Sumerlaeia bacterium]
MMITAAPVQRKTLRRIATFKGNGIHTNAECTLHLLPTIAGTGIQAKRTGKPGLVPINIDYASAEKSVRRTVVVGPAPESLVFEQLEHVMAALAAADVTDVIIELDATEPPFMGGGSLEFLQGILAVGTEGLEGMVQPLVVNCPLAFDYGEAHFAATPHDGFRLSCFIEFPGTIVGSTGVSFEIDSDSFYKNVAVARTFAKKADLEKIWAAGLGKGGTLENTVVFNEDSYLNERLYFEDEVARHKIIDFLGDLALIGRPLRGHFWAWRAGHQSHVAFAQKLVRKYGT